MLLKLKCLHLQSLQEEEVRLYLVPLYPYLFITIACGAISGFHSLISSGTTPKMIIMESHIRPIAVGSMLAESVVSILALIAATSMLPLDYFIINIPVEKFAKALPVLHQMGFHESNIDELSRQVGENIKGRTGGAVSLAVGMAQIFSSIPGLKSYDVILVSFCNYV